MTSRREHVLDAIKTLVASALPNAEVKRNLAKPERIPPGGLAIIRDGDPGEPEITLSPLAYTYEHRVPLEIAVLASSNATREEALDEMLRAIGTAIESSRTLGGLCEFLDPEAPVAADLEATGSQSARWADMTIVATYTTTNPLT